MNIKIIRISLTILSLVPLYPSPGIVTDIGEPVAPGHHHRLLAPDARHAGEDQRSSLIKSYIKQLL